MCQIVFTLDFVFLYEHPNAKTMRKIFGIYVKAFRKHVSCIMIHVKNLNIVSKSHY